MMGYVRGALTSIGNETKITIAPGRPQLIGNKESITRKRFIEYDLPLAEISEQSAREKNIRHGHPSTLHIWWARRLPGRRE